MCKRYILLALAALLQLSFAAVAQEQESTSPSAHRKFTSIRLGPSLATVAGRDVANVGWQVGAHAGVSLLSMESEDFGVQTEVQYSFQGAAIDGGHLLLHYITVPVTAKYFIAPKASLQGGGYGSLLLSKAYEYEASRNSPNMEGMDYGLTYGLSFGDEGKATVSLRHYLGLANVIGKHIKAKNQVIQLSVAFCVSKK